MTELRLAPNVLHLAPPVQKKWARSEREGEIEHRDSDIAHAALALTGSQTCAPSEQFGRVNKVSFMEAMRQGGLPLHN